MKDLIKVAVDAMGGDYAPLEPVKGAIEAVHAKEELFVETLEKRWSDNLDFYDVSVWGIKRALERAYEAGQKSVK